MIPTSPLDGGVGAAGLPKALAWTLGGLAVLLILRSGLFAIAALRAATRGDSTGEVAGDVPAPASGIPPPPHSRGQRGGSWWVHWRAIVMLAFGIAYVAAIEWLGYWLTVLLLFSAVAVYNGARVSWRMVMIAVGMSSLFFVLFVKFLSIPLPPGIWPALLSG